MRRRGGLVRFTAPVVAALLALILTTSCAAAPPPGIRFAAIGDSITASTDQHGSPTHWTWVATAATDGLRDVGGYRHYGDTTGDILHHVTPIPEAQVVVVMAGTNDAPVDGHPDPQTLANISAIFDAAAVPGRILSAVAPRDDDRAAETLELNRDLKDLAGRSGWTFVDPWTAVRTPAGHWRPGTTGDGIHPTPHAGRIAGDVLREAIERVARQSTLPVLWCAERSPAAVRDLQQHVRVAPLIEPAPAGQVLARQLRDDAVASEDADGVLPEHIDGRVAPVLVDRERVAPAGRSRDDDGVLGLAPSLPPT